MEIYLSNFKQHRKWITNLGTGSSSTPRPNKFVLRESPNEKSLRKWVTWIVLFIVSTIIHNTVCARTSWKIQVNIFISNNKHIEIEAAGLLSLYRSANAFPKRKSLPLGEYYSGVNSTTWCTCCFVWLYELLAAIERNATPFHSPFIIVKCHSIANLPPTRLAINSPRPRLLLPPPQVAPSPAFVAREERNRSKTFNTKWRKSE